MKKISLLLVIIMITTLITQNVYANPIESNVISQNTVQKVIIKTKTNLSEAECLKLIEPYSGQINQVYESINGFSATLTTDAIQLISSDPNVEKIYTDKTVSASAYNDDTVKITSTPQVWEQKGVEGQGVTVAIIDTGVYPHKDLTANGNRILKFVDFINGQQTAYDDSGHGTHVAGIIGGDGYLSNGKYKGIAPKVNIVSLKVLDSTGSGYNSDVIAAIDWVIRNKNTYNIKVINLSLGSDYTTQDDPVILAVNRAWQEGIVVIAASGNNGPNSVVSAPAASSTIIAVGGSDSIGTIQPMDDKLAYFTSLPQTINNVKKPEVFAPSINVISLISPNGLNAINYPTKIIENNYFRMSGTSMATPAVSGISALLLSENPNLTPNQIKEIVMTSSIEVGQMDIVNSAKSFGLEPVWTEKILTGIRINEELPKQGSIQLTVSGIYSDNSISPVTSGVIWNTNNPEVATITTNGYVSFTGKTGQVTITATHGNYKASISQIVEPILIGIQINEQLPKEGSIQLTISGLYSDNTIKPLFQNISWISSNLEVATVTSDGYVTFTGKAGDVTIKSTYGEYTDSVSQTIIPILTGIKINEQLPNTGSIQLTVSGLYSDNTVKSIQEGIIWSSSNPIVATVTPTGYVNFTGKAGDVSIIANYQNFQYSVSQNIVDPNKIAKIQIKKIHQNDKTIKYDLIGYYPNGKSIILNKNINWHSTPLYIGVISKNGIVKLTGISGELTITATYENLETKYIEIVNNRIRK